MTANYTGGGLVGRRKAKRRVRQDITGTPAYSAAAKQAYQVRPGPLLADHSAAHLLGGRRKGQPLASPSFDFAFLRNKQNDNSTWTRPAASETRRAGVESSWTTTAPVPLSRATGGSTFLRQQLLANPDWAGLHSIPRPQPSFLPSSRPAASTSKYSRLPSPRPDPHGWSRHREPAPTILRGSSVLHGIDNGSSASLVDLPRSTPPSFILSRTTSLDAASAAAQFRIESPAGSAAVRAHDLCWPRPQQAPFSFNRIDIADRLDEHETNKPQQQYGEYEEHEMLSFTSSTHDPAFGPQLSAQAYAARYTALEDGAPLDGDAPRPASRSPTLADSPAPSPAPASASPPPYHHLSHLHDPLMPHLADSLDLSHLDDDEPGVLLVHERMGLGCTGLSRAQADELAGRELALRAAGVDTVPEWAWGDGEASEEKWEEDGEGGSCASEEDSPSDPPRTLDMAAAPVVAYAPAPLAVAASSSLDRSSLAAGAVNSAHHDSAPAVAPGWWRRWRKTTDGGATGMLFAVDDVRGVMEP
ncbi:hypothetical protein JCM9279_005727 [Rhodotorula babjevae]